MNRLIASLIACGSFALIGGCASVPSDNQQLAMADKSTDCKVVYYSSASQTISASVHDSQVGQVVPNQSDNPAEQQVGVQTLGAAQVRDPRLRIGGAFPNSNVAQARSGC